MKSILPGVILLTVLSAASGGAQEQTPAPQPSPSPTPGPSASAAPAATDGLHARMREKFQELPPDIQKRIADARTAVLKDPGIQQLKKKADDDAKALRTAMRDAMIKTDPGLADYLKDFIKGNGSIPKPGGHGNPNLPPGFANLSDPEKQQLLVAWNKAKSDPAVQAAGQKRDAAKTPQERREAGAQYFAAVRDAALKIDPSLAPVLDKLHAPAPQQQGSASPSVQPSQSPQAQ